MILDHRRCASESATRWGPLGMKSIFEVDRLEALAACLVAIGSNRGDRFECVRQAVAGLRSDPRIQSVRVSHLQESAAIIGSQGRSEQPASARDDSSAPYVNGAIYFETHLTAQATLDLLLELESRAGRRRTDRWGSRELDLDLLLYNEMICQTRYLTLPHPRMVFRRFVLEPAVELAPAWRHPTTGWQLRELLEHLDRAAPYLALCGPQANQLATELADWRPVRLVHDPVEKTQLDLSVSDPLSGQLDRLHARLAALARALAPFQVDGCSPLTSTWVISDFWLEQTWFDARRVLERDAFLEFHAAWRRLEPQMVWPRLLVFLDASNSVERPCVSSRYGGPFPDAWSIASPEARSGLIGLEPGRSGVAEAGPNEYVSDSSFAAWCRQPWFTVGAADWEWATREIRAALEAMSSATSSIYHRPV
jgi:2-amino-4-hydroxy-6-hydroxymethyldihydropteridine diphosphokinase